MVSGKRGCLAVALVAAVVSLAGAGASGASPKASPLSGEFTFVSHTGNGYIYRVEGAARVRFVRAAHLVAADREAVTRLLNEGFDPDAEVLLHEAPASLHPTTDEARRLPSNPPGRAVVTREDARHIGIDADAPADGFLLLADTSYPGWTARVDGTPTAVYRANLSVRAIALPKGRHEILFTYDAPGFYRGLWITLAAIGVLLLWAGGAYAGRGVR